MTTNQLRHFLCLAETGSMSKAASRLYMTQQALSKSISNLESELGVSLFDRTQKGCELTHFGRRICSVVRIMLKDYDERIEMIYSIAGKGGESAIRLGLEHNLMQYLLPNDFMNRIGDVRVDIWIADSYSYLEDAVRNSYCDLGLVHKPEKPLAKDLSYTPVMSDELPLLMNKSFFLSKKENIFIEDLRFVPLIMPKVKANILDQLIQKCVEAGFYPKIVYETNEYGILLRMVEENSGVAVGTGCAVKPDVASDDLVIRRLKCDDLRLDVGFIKKKANNSSLVDSFISAVNNLFI